MSAWTFVFNDEGMDKLSREFLQRLSSEIEDKLIFTKLIERERRKPAMRNEKQHEIIVKEYNPGIEDQDEVLYSEAVVEAVKELAALKAQEGRMADQKKQAQDIIQEFHFNTGARNFNVPGVGSITTYLASRSTVNAKDVGKWLVEHGVSAELIKESMVECTKTSVSSSVTVRFTPER